MGNGGDLAGLWATHQCNVLNGFGFPCAWDSDPTDQRAFPPCSSGGKNRNPSHLISLRTGPQKGLHRAQRSVTKLVHVERLISELKVPKDCRKSELQRLALPSFKHDTGWSNLKGCPSSSATPLLGKAKPVTNWVNDPT